MSADLFDLLTNLKNVCDALELILSADPDMPTFRDDCAEAEKALEFGRAAIAKAEPKP